MYGFGFSETSNTGGDKGANPGNSSTCGDSVHGRGANKKVHADQTNLHANKLCMQANVPHCRRPWLHQQRYHFVDNRDCVRPGGRCVWGGSCHGTGAPASAASAVVLLKPSPGPSWLFSMREGAATAPSATATRTPPPPHTPRPMPATIATEEAGEYAWKLALRRLSAHGGNQQKSVLNYPPFAARF